MASASENQNSATHNASNAIPDDDKRMDAIRTWLTSLTPALRIESLRPASADASFRRYFRVDAVEGGSFIVMDAPPPVEDVRPFIQVAQLFERLNLSVPKIYARDVDQGLLLLQDFGNTMYFHALNHDTAHKLYMDAIDSLVLLQTQSEPDVLPEYDRDFFLRELMIFPEWYIGKHLGITLTDEQNASLQKVFEAILANVTAQPQVFVHRDFHSRNLMVLDKGNPGIIDFQGAMYGPLTYDVVSMLRDAYVQWDEEMVLDWAIR